MVRGWRAYPCAVHAEPPRIVNTLLVKPLLRGWLHMHDMKLFSRPV